jgi:8-oxo-dGTP pyrophosphatase MutT (NUDIX family)
MGAGSSAKITQSLPLPKRRQQVAAVCYRIRKRGIEFLLVQTRGGRWIFPKGGVEPGLTCAQSAALEAFEEAGVHGRVEEIPFARYFRRKMDLANPAQADRPKLSVNAHLCEVSRLEPPQESNRNPTWFLAEKAKQRLLKDRALELGTELMRVVDRALSRIERLHGARKVEDRIHRDSLWHVQFEAFVDGCHHDPHPAILEQGRLGQLNFLPQHRRQNEIIHRSSLRLGAGMASPAEATHKVTAIDILRGINPEPRKFASIRNVAKPR